MYRLISFNYIFKLDIGRNISRFYSRFNSSSYPTSIHGLRSIVNTNSNIFINRNYVNTNRNLISGNSNSKSFRRFNHQDNVNNNKITNDNSTISTNNSSKPSNVDNIINGSTKNGELTRREKAIRRIKTRFQNFKTYINQNKKVQKFKIYVNQNKRIQNFKIFINNNQRFQRFRLYAVQKRQNFKGFTNKVKRREKLKAMKDKFMDKSRAFSLLTMLTLKRYGKIGVFIYLSVYVATLAGMNAIVFLNYLTSEHVRKALAYFNITSLKVPDVDSPFAKFTVAYIATKLVEPLRLVVSILITVGVTRIIKR